MPSSRAPDERPPHTRYAYRDATDDEAKALASGLRLRILRMTLDDPLTNKQIADALGKPAASILHHVRTLVDTGFLAAEDPRRGARGAREIPYRATGKSWYVHAPVGVHSMLDAFLTEVQDVPEDQLRMTRLGLRMSREDLDEFSRRLYELLKEMHDRPRDLSAPPHSLFLAIHPDTSAPPG
ncbi:MAG: winged helix-turn-helix domain-containing protein [Ornithinimicrobium sp.]